MYKMLLFIMLGVLFLVFSLLFFFAPKTIIKISEVGNKMIFTDHSTLAHRFFSGFILFVMSLIMFYLGNSIK